MYVLTHGTLRLAETREPSCKHREYDYTLENALVIGIVKKKKNIKKFLENESKIRVGNLVVVKKVGPNLWRVHDRQGVNYVLAEHFRVS